VNWDHGLNVQDILNATEFTDREVDIVLKRYADQIAHRILEGAKQLAIVGRSLGGKLGTMIFRASRLRFYQGSGRSHSESKSFLFGLTPSEDSVFRRREGNRFNPCVRKTPRSPFELSRLRGGRYAYVNHAAVGLNR